MQRMVRIVGSPWSIVFQTVDNDVLTSPVCVLLTYIKHATEYYAGNYFNYASESHVPACPVYFVYMRVHAETAQ